MWISTCMITGGFGESLIDPPPEKKRIIEAYEEIFVRTDARNRIVAAFESARFFLPFVRSRLAGRGMPEDIAFLPIIESGYNPEATSPSGAAGIWQFMENTSVALGMRVDEFVDERRDLWKSTIGALEKLSSDFERFRSWELALAAYNCGTNCVRTAIETVGVSDYWILAESGALPAETVAYVPKFAALLNLIRRADEYGYEKWRAVAYDWARIPVPHPVRLDRVAAHAGIDIDLLRLGNAELRAGATPPTSTAAPAGEPYYLKVPDVYAEIVGRTVNNPEVQMTDYLVYRIKPGDTLSSIARRYGVSVDLVRNYNPGILPRFLQINTSLIVPNTVERGDSRRHVVRPGETLWSIAIRYRTTVESIVRRNAISDPDRIFPGIALTVPADSR